MIWCEGGWGDGPPCVSTRLTWVEEVEDFHRLAVEPVDQDIAISRHDEDAAEAAVLGASHGGVVGEERGGGLDRGDDPAGGRGVSLGEPCVGAGEVGHRPAAEPDLSHGGGRRTP